MAETDAGDVHGRFLWYELLSPDPGSAASFYTDVVGWDTELWTAPGQEPYTTFTHGDTHVGGIMELPEEARAAGAPPHWLPYIGTPDVDATAREAAEGGGKVLVQPTDIPEVGRFSVLEDPHGAVFAAYRPAGPHPGGRWPPQVGDFSWNELATLDREAAFAFYRSLFGWRKTDAMDMGEAGIYQMYGRDDEAPLGGIFDKPAEMEGPAFWLCYIRVEDLDGAVGQVEAGGGRVLNGPMEVPGGDRIVQCADPQGGAFALHERAGGTGAES